MKTIGERINAIMIHFFGEERGNKAKFARSVGEKSNTVSNWFSRGDGIGKDVISKILLIFPTVNLKWLLTGVGPMLNEPTSGNVVGSHLKGTFIGSSFAGGNIIGIGNTTRNANQEENGKEELENEIIRLREENTILKTQVEDLNQKLLSEKERMIEILLKK